MGRSTGTWSTEINEITGALACGQITRDQARKKLELIDDEVAWDLDIEYLVSYAPCEPDEDDALVHDAQIHKVEERLPPFHYFPKPADAKDESEKNVSAQRTGWVKSVDLDEDEVF